jgi:hypothetical protein
MIIPLWDNSSCVLIVTSLEISAELMQGNPDNFMLRGECKLTAGFMVDEIRGLGNM